MKLSQFIAAAILAFIPVAPSFAAPLSAKNINQTPGKIAPIQVSAVPNGPFVPSSYDIPSETMVTRLSSHLDNLEKFPHTVNDDLPTKMTDTGPILDSYTGNSYKPISRQTGRFQFSGGMLRSFGPRSLNASNSPSSWDETSTEQNSQQILELDDYKYCMKEPMNIDGLTWYTYQIIDHVYKVTTGLRKPLTDSNDNKTCAHESKNKISRHYERRIAFPRGTELKRHHLCELVIPNSQDNKLAPRDWSSAEYEMARQDRIEFESQFILSADLQRRIASLLEGRLRNSNSETSLSTNVNRRDSKTEHGIWQNVASSVITAAANAPAFIVKGAGDAYVSEYEPEIESEVHGWFHRPKKLHKEPHKKSSSASMPAPCNKSTSVQDQT